MARNVEFIISTVLCIAVAISQSTLQTTVVYRGAVSTVNCPEMEGFDKVIWEGPPNLFTYYLYQNGSGLFNPDLNKTSRLSIAANFSLTIADTQLVDGGDYICKKATVEINRNLTTRLDVRISADAPRITSTTQIDGSNVLATEDGTLTIICTSRGGYPATTVVMYKGDVTGQVLQGTVSTIQENDHTYTVKLTYIFIPKRQDDRQLLVCRSYWPTSVDTQDSQITNVMLYLYLKPNQPTLTVTDAIVTGSNITAVCKSTGGRPATNISWTFRNEKLTGSTTTTNNISTQTYTTEAVLHRTVTSADNGLNLTCKASHLTGEQTIERTLNIQFAVPSSSTHLSGDKTIEANGVNELTLTCTTGSSNPASEIIWEKGNSIINNASPPSLRPGENNGFIRSQNLTLRPTRIDNGQTVKCSVSNVVLSVADTASVTLDLNYRPIVTIHEPSVTISEQSSQSTVRPVVLQCIVDGKPLSTVTWHHNGIFVKQAANVSSLPYSISIPSRTSYGNYMCTADNGVGPVDKKTSTIKVQFRPLNVSIEMPGTILADGTNTMLISCVTGSSNPTAVVTWSTGSILASTPVNSNSSGPYGGTISTSRITFTPTREHDGLNVSCTARNSLFTNQPVSAGTAIDNIRYSPLINTLTNQVVVEGDNVVLECYASSNPVASFIWTFSSGTVAEGSGTTSYNGLNYNITAVSRNQSGTYNCSAYNQIPPNDSKQTRLVVRYPPDVVVTAMNTTVHNQSTTLTCVALGVPNQYTYDHWVHKFNGVQVLHPKPLPVSRELTLTDLSYANSGVYRCGASNGVKNVSHDEGTLLVESFPVFIGSIANTRVIKANGQLFKPSVITFQYYSNAGSGSIRVLKTKGSQEDVEEVHQRSVDVRLPVFLSEIATLGTEVTINITVMNKSQFGEYQIVVTNRIGHANLSLIIQPSAPSDTTTPSSTGLIAGSAAGGTVAALLVIAVIIIIVWRRRDTSPTKNEKGKGALVMSRNHNLGYENDDEEVENPAYESAGPRETETAMEASSSQQKIPPINAKIDNKPEVVYAMPNKQKGISTKQTVPYKNEQHDKDVYAVPDKTKGEKKKKGKYIKTPQPTGKVYENTPSTMSGSKSTLQSGESVYEDTSTTISAAPMKPTGTDGLLYAVLEFGPRTNDPSKIIGLEDRCEYTTIDLLKKAQPLPDSDDA